MNEIMEGGEPFFFPGDRTGCLLIHGFTGTPKEMRWLGEHLATDGRSVLGVRLFAHATHPEDMLRARWQDWMASVEDGYNLLRDATDRIVVLGLSMGGILSLWLAARLPVAGVVAMSTPFYPPDRRMRPLHRVAPLLTLVWRWTPKGPPDWHDPRPAADHLEYPKNPVRGGALLYDAILGMQKALPSVTVPVLIIHSKGDLTLPEDHAHRLYESLPGDDKQILWVENSGHVVTRDAERDKVFAAAAAFVRRVAGVGA
jgi:carboxylesterase